MTSPPFFKIQHLYTGNACRKISLSQPSLLDNALIFNLLLHATPESSSADGVSHLPLFSRMFTTILSLTHAFKTFQMVVFKRSNYLGSKLRFDYRYYAYNTRKKLGVLGNRYDVFGPIPFGNQVLLRSHE